MSLPWHKWWGEKWLNSKLRKSLTPVERYCFHELVTLSSLNNPRGVIGNPILGGISATKIASSLEIGVKSVVSTIAKAKANKTIFVHENGVIEFYNWEEYQPKSRSRAEDMRKLRERKKQGVTGNVTGNGDGNDSDVTCNVTAPKILDVKILDVKSVEEETAPPVDNSYPVSEQEANHDFCGIYRSAFGRLPSMLVQTEIANHVNKYGADATIAAMKKIGAGGWSFGNVEKVLRGEWDKPKDKPRGRPNISTNENEADFECEECGREDRKKYKIGDSPVLCVCGGRMTIKVEVVK